MRNRSWTLLAGLALSALLLGCPDPINPNPPAPPAGPTYPGSAVTETVETEAFGLVRAIAPWAEASLAAAPAEADWYKDQVFYHVWLSAFQDSASDTDTIGDLKGLISRLDYLKEDVGATALWLSPFFKTASGNSNLHGYDVTDHYAVDPRFGTMADVVELLKQAHARGMRVIFDFVPNHVSSQHPWFTESASGPGSAKRDWFLWSATRPAGWTGWDAASDWHARNGAYYYGIFWDGMPDLNYRNAEVRKAMADAAIYWLNLGFDGLRIDAVKYLYENLDGTGAFSDQSDRPETIQYFKDFRQQVLDLYGEAGYAKFMVAENWTNDEDSLNAYLGTPADPSFQMVLDFTTGEHIYDTLSGQTGAVDALADHWGRYVQSLSDENRGWTGTFLNNHDNYQNRPATQFANQKPLIRLAMALQTLGPGTPFLYYGNELMQTNANAEGDMRFRFPPPWASLNAARNDSRSPLNWQRTLNDLRQERISLRRGSFTRLSPSAGVEAFVRSAGTERTLVILNTKGSEASGATFDLSSFSVTSLATLIGDTADSVLAEGTLTINSLPGFGVRVLGLNETQGTPLWPDYAEAVTSGVNVVIAARPAAGESYAVRYMDADGTVLATVAAQKDGPDYYTSHQYVGGTTAGRYQVIRRLNGEMVQEFVPVDFQINWLGVTYALTPFFNADSSDTWALRGNFSGWGASADIPMVLQEDQAGRVFRGVLPAATLSALTAENTYQGKPLPQFKIVSGTALNDWDYNLGYFHVEYDETLGVDASEATGIWYGWTDQNAYNHAFVAKTGVSYEIWFEERIGTSRLWITEVTP